MTTEEKSFTPNMDKLKAELGRTPPPPLATKVEDFAPKPPPVRITHTELTESEAELAQVLKTVMREHGHSDVLTYTPREVLDQIASRIAGICIGRNLWSEISELADLADEHMRGGVRSGV